MKNDWKKTRHIEQTCGDCIIRITAHAPDESGYPGYMGVDIASNSISKHHMKLKNRLKNSWRVLWGDYTWSGFDLNDPDEAMQLAKHLEELTEFAYPREL